MCLEKKSQFCQCPLLTVIFDLEAGPLPQQRNQAPYGQVRVKHPTNTFTISKPQDQEIGEFYVVQERLAKLQNCERVRRVRACVGKKEREKKEMKGRREKRKKERRREKRKKEGRKERRSLKCACVKFQSRVF